MMKISSDIKASFLAKRKIESVTFNQTSLGPISEIGQGYILQYGAFGGAAK